MRPHALSGPFLILLLAAFPFISSGQVFFENFEGEANGATTGTAVGGSWTITPPSSGVFARANVGAPYNGIIYIDNTTNEGVWRSNVLNISALGEVALEVLMGGNNATAADYVRAYYVLDGGAEVMFAGVLGAAGTVVFTASSAVVSGTSLQIVIRGRDNSGGGGIMGFDDVTITDIGVLYSRARSAWNLGSTWSTAGFAGASCSCTPDADSRVIIGNGRNVTFTADGSAAGVEIQNTGTLTWLTNNNSDLTIQRGGAVNVQAGGTLTRGTTTGSTVQFANYTYSITNAGTINIGALVFNGSGNSTLNNSGTITLATAVGLSIAAGSNGYVFTNTGTINFQDLSINNSNITVNNAGTINQTGNFTGVDAGSTFNNQSNGTWNFSGTTITNVRLFANNNSNTFNYNGAAQTIITPQDAYWNLTLSNSGAKTAAANFTVNGNWTRTGTATFTHGGFRVTLDGTAPQTIAAVGGEVFANLTIDNSSATSPQITLNNAVTVATNLTMTDGNVNLNGNTFTISPTAGGLTHSQLPAAGWMYGGPIVRSFATSAVAVGNVNGFYPIGGSADFRPFLISKNGVIASSNGTITVTYTDASTATNIIFMDGATQIQRRHDSFWTLTKTGVTAGTFQISLGGTGFTIAAVNQTRLTRQSDVIATFAASSGAVTDVRVHRSGLTAAQLLNNFYLASTSAATSPLPIELAWFRARLERDEVITSWKTLQEKNNHYFTIEKTTDFETFYDVGTLDGQGNSTEEHSYSFVDDSPFMGKSYYRLKQTDFDGTFTFSDPVMIEYYGPAYPFLRVFPNPFNGRSVTVEVKGISGATVVPVMIYNQQGQKVLELLIEQDGPGVFKKETMFPDNLQPGLYVMKAGRTLQLTSKLIVN
jgi:hypothetical protein